MTEALAAEIAELPAVESGVNIKTKVATAAGIGGLGVLAYFAEKYGWIHSDWPPPMRSFKHPWVGYYAAAISDKVFKKSRNTAAVASGQIANVAVKDAQSAVHHADGNPWHWLNGHHHEIQDNFSDFVLCLGGTALYLAQDRGIPDYIKGRVSGLFARRTSPEAAEA